MIQSIVGFKAFHSAILKTKFRRSRCDFFIFSLPILDFKHSSTAKISLEEVEISNSRTELSKQFDFLETSHNQFFRKRTFHLIENFGATIGCASSSLING